MTKRGRSIDGPFAFVEALAGRAAGKGKAKAKGRGKLRHRRRRGQPPILLVGRKTLRAAGTAAETLSKRAARGSKRRRAALKKVSKRLERVSTAANNVGTLLGIAAAGAELVSAVRDHKGEGRASQVTRAGTNGAHRKHREEEEVLEDAR